MDPRRLLHKAGLSAWSEAPPHPAPAARSRQCTPPRRRNRDRDRRRGMVPLSPLGLTAKERDRNVPHGRIGLGTMPMALAGLNVRHVTDVDLALLMLCRDDAGTR